MVELDKTPKGPSFGPSDSPQILLTPTEPNRVRQFTIISSVYSISESFSNYSGTGRYKEILLTRCMNMHAGVGRTDTLHLNHKISPFHFLHKIQS
jgi:hypothetical protein